MRTILQRILVSQSWQLSVLLIAWILTQLVLGLNLGIRPELESLKYIREARNLLETGSFSAPRFMFYGFTSSIIAIGFKTGLGFPLVVALQLLWNLAASISLFYALGKIEKIKGAALITTLILVFCIPYQTWNFYLYTESFFYSNTLLFFAACTYFQKHISTKGILAQFVALSMAIFSRPLGILLLPCWLFFLMMQIPSRKGRNWFIIALLSGGLISTFVINTILSTISDWSVLRPFAEGHIICDMPGSQSIDLSSIDKGTPLEQLWEYVTTYPGHLISLASKRLSAFFLLARPYYSSLHNAVLLLLVVLLYIPPILQLFKTKTWSSLTYLSCAIIAVFTITVALQCDDYHNRFHNTLIPVWLTVGLFGQINGSKKLLSKVS